MSLKGHGHQHFSPNDLKNTPAGSIEYHSTWEVLYTFVVATEAWILPWYVGSQKG